MEHKCSKQPSEQFKIMASFGKVIATGESSAIGSCSVTAQDSTGADASSDVIVANSLAASGSTDLTCSIKDGTVALSPYKITFNMVTDAGNKFELDIELIIFEE